MGEEVSNFLSNLTNDGVTERFSETFIETHKNVSILYADICGFTPLTEKFTKKIINGREVPIDRIEDLVATLNDLFAKFDEAADVSVKYRVRTAYRDKNYILESQLYENQNIRRLLLLHIRLI